MGKLIYSMQTSLDGFVTAEDSKSDWSGLDAESHQFINDRSRAIGTYLYGRRMYETMVYGRTHPPRRMRRTCGSTRGSGRRPRRSSTRPP